VISVIIPVVNESETVGRVVGLALAHEQVDEVIVVDDGSIDDTPEQARQAGARVLTSTFLGKGASLQDGVNAAHNKVLVFLDAHLTELPPDLINRLTQPILEHKIDLVKSDAGGSTDPVCRLTARPLMRVFFPELNEIERPVSGIWAARRSLLQKLPFEIDQGVEVGLLLDAFRAGASIEQVEVGPVEVNEEPAELQQEAADQVTHTILDRAARENRLKGSYFAEVLENSAQDQSDLVRVLQRGEPAQRLALFDMDGVLVQGNFILELAHQLGKGARLAEYLDDPDLQGDEQTEKIAALFAGVPRVTFEEVARDLPLMPGARETVAALRRRGYLVGIVSEAFQAAAKIIRRRLLADFSIAHLMKFKRGKATGRMTFAPALSDPQGCPDHPHCKANIVPYLTELFGVSRDRILAVGNGVNDVCLLRAAGHSVAFRPTHPAVRAAATQVVQGGALTELLHVLDEPRGSVVRTLLPRE
jgi:phosphoserine phosphatase